MLSPSAAFRGTVLAAVLAFAVTSSSALVSTATAVATVLQTHC